MQKITVKEVKPSTADNKPTVITTDDGSKMSGFDGGLKSLSPGDVLEVDVEVKKGYTNITEFKVLEKAGGGTSQKVSSSSNGRYSLEAIQLESDTRIQIAKINRGSIEGQVALKDLGETIRTSPDLVVDDMRTLYFEVIKEKIEAFRNTLDLKGAVARGLSCPGPQPPTTENLEGRTFKNVGEFLSACLDEGIPRRDVLDKLGVAEKDISKIDTAASWLIIYEELIKPKREKK